MFILYYYYVNTNLFLKEILILTAKFDFCRTESNYFLVAKTELCLLQCVQLSPKVGEQLILEDSLMNDYVIV